MTTWWSQKWRLLLGPSLHVHFGATINRLSLGPIGTQGSWGILLPLNNIPGGGCLTLFLLAASITSIIRVAAHGPWEKVLLLHLMLVMLQSGGPLHYLRLSPRHSLTRCHWRGFIRRCSLHTWLLRVWIPLDSRCHHHHWGRSDCGRLSLSQQSRIRLLLGVVIMLRGRLGDF
jgi:hypothetical protein